MHICRPIYYNIYEIECSSLRIFLRHLTWHSDDPTSSPAFFPLVCAKSPHMRAGCLGVETSALRRHISWFLGSGLLLARDSPPWIISVHFFPVFRGLFSLFFTSLPFVFCYLYNRIDSHEHAETRLPTSVAILSCRLAHGWCIQICRVASKSSLLCPESTIFRVNC